MRKTLIALAILFRIFIDTGMAEWQIIGEILDVDGVYLVIGEKYSDNDGSYINMAWVQKIERFERKV